MPTQTNDPRTWPLEDRPLIYVAGYFSANPMHGTGSAIRAAERLLKAGWLPSIPHINIIWDIVVPHYPDFWYAYDLGMLRQCKAMYVCPDILTMESTGVANEITFCEEHNIPIIRDILDPRMRGTT